MKNYLRLTNIFLFLFLLIFFAAITKIYYERVGSFSFGDEWNNFTAAFFMLKGRMLYSHIFYNHQVLPVYISYLIQRLFHPKTMYALVLYHRMFIVLFSFTMDLFLIFRFKKNGILFVLFYESTKFYLFGNLFLAESLIVQPVVYMFGIAWEKIQKIRISRLDLILSAVFCWFIVFTREPYVPLVVILYGTILFEKNIHRINKYSIGVFILLCALMIIPLYKSFYDYFFQVIVFNLTITLSRQIVGQGAGIDLAKVFFYPILIFFDGKWNYFRNILIELDSIFLLLLFVFTLFLKRIKETFFVLFILGLAGIRFIPPGVVFYDAFHMLQWWGVFIFGIILLIAELHKNKKFETFHHFLLCSVCLILIYTIFSSGSFIWEKVNKQEEFTRNYAHYYINAEVIRLLSNPKNTLFADQWDYFIHWHANLDSSYEYAIYSFTTKGYERYRIARENMFRTNPPDFYYTFCAKNEFFSKLLPKDSFKDYAQLYRDSRPSCLYVRSAILSGINKSQWMEAKKIGFSLQ